MKANKTETADFQWRFLAVVAGFIALALGLACRSVFLHVINQDFLIHEGDMRTLRLQEITAHRGIIKDRRQKPLAVSSPVASVWVKPKEMMESRQQWKELAKLCKMPYGQLKDIVLSNQNKSFVYLKRHISPQQAEQIKALDIAGVNTIKEYRRFYPSGEIAAHVVGMTNIDDVGQEGLELAYGESLQGLPGKKRVLKDRKGRVIQDLDIIKTAEPGQDLVLSIDLRAQHIAYRELLAAVRAHKADSGSVVVLNVETGEVLALVNQPSFNPNNRSSIKRGSLRNRALTDVFEPGSTMKPFTVAAAMETGQYKAGTPIDTAPGYIKVGRKVIRDHRNYGLINVEKVLTKSSNVGSTMLALSLKPGILQEMLGRLGLGVDTASAYPGESSGFLPDREKWQPIEVATLSYGYGLSVTTLQLAQAYAVLASGGIKRPVSLTKVEHAPKGERVLSENISRQIVAMLETVVSVEGTASRARIPGYRVAGKTGTVHKLTKEGYADDQYISLFAGMAPASDPKIVTVVMVNNPRGEDYFGGLIAAPVFAKVSSGILRLLNVMPDDVSKQMQGIVALNERA